MGDYRPRLPVRAPSSHQLILFLCLDEGGFFNRVRRPDAARNDDVVFDALARLHAHGCLIASEVLALLRTGHADGANARWRALHETAVAATFIAKHGAATAERFLLHDGVKSYEDSAVYQEHCERLGYEAFTDAEMLAMSNRYKALLAKFGDDYRGGYGWASTALRSSDPPHKGSISFVHIEKDVGVPHFQPYYRMASHAAHAGAKSIRFSLGLIEPSPLLLAGPSNAGLADPGQCTAISLANLTAIFLNHKLDQQPLEDAAQAVAALMTIQTFVDECCAAFAGADVKLKADEARIRKQDRKKQKK